MSSCGKVVRTRSSTSGAACTESTHSGVYTPMVMNMCTQIFQSLIASQKYFISNSSAKEERSSFSRWLTASRSGCVRKGAVDG